MIELPKQVFYAIESLNKSGYEAYAVGGCVRNSLLGIPVNDWDLTTNALPNQVKETLRGHRVIETGIKHGTIAVVIDQMPIEITTYRTEGTYSDHRRPDFVTFSAQLKEDLSRRDFTMNGIAYHPKTGIIDYFCGEKHIHLKQIHCIGDPDIRLTEDGLRILRALRFSSVLGFEIQGSTAKSIHENKQLLKQISKERIIKELNGIVTGGNAESVLMEYADVIGVFIPEILPLIGFDQQNPYHKYDIWEHTIKSMAYVKPDLVTRLAALFHDMGKPDTFFLDEKKIGHFYGHNKVSAKMAEEVLKRLKYDRHTIEKVSSLVYYHDAHVDVTQKNIRKWLGRIGEEDFRRLIDIKIGDTKGKAKEFWVNAQVVDSIEKQLNQIKEEEKCFCLKDLNINGNDLLAIGIPKGKQIGVLLDLILKKVMEEDLRNEKKELLRLAVKLKKDL